MTKHYWSIDETLSNLLLCHENEESKESIQNLLGGGFILEEDKRNVWFMSTTGF